MSLLTGILSSALHPGVIIGTYRFSLLSSTPEDAFKRRQRE
jgi:hypothetical protein